MRKEKKIKTRKQEKKTMTLIGIVLAIFLGAILFWNARSAFNKMETRNCVKSMVLMEEAMLQMKKEFRLDVPSNIRFEELASMMAHYFHFGPNVFQNPTTGTLKLKSKEGMFEIPLTQREDRYILDIPRCPSKGKYTLIPNKEFPGLYNIICSKHGTLFLTKEKNQYMFTGDIEALNPKKTALGREADVYFSPEESPKEFVTVIPYTDEREKGKNKEEDSKQ